MPLTVTVRYFAAAREKAQKTQERVTLPEGATVATLLAQLFASSPALKGLEKHDRRKYDEVMLRYFAGLSIEETADALEISPATVKNDWTFARAWLKRQVAGADAMDADE